MTSPFMEIDAFKAEFGALTDAQTATATRLLQVVSDDIRSRKDDVAPLAAQQVVFEVVQDAMNYGEYERRLSNYVNTTSRKTDAGTFDKTRDADDYLSNRQKRLLGILVAAPAYNFPDCDTGIPGYDC